MSEAKAEILRRIRAALGGSRNAPEVPRAYLHASESAQGELVERFVERATDYRATVHRTTEAGLREAVKKVCDLRGAETLVAPADVPGFIGNRLQHALWREAISLVEKGVSVCVLTPLLRDPDETVRLQVAKQTGSDSLATKGHSVQLQDVLNWGAHAAHSF